MLSAYEADSEKSYCVYIGDMTFIEFEDCPGMEIDDDRSADGHYAHRNLVKLQSDGYFAVKEIKTGIYVFWGYVQDADGYSNVRKAPNIKSEVLYKVYEGSYILAYGEPDSKWFEVVLIREPGSQERSAEKMGGYIHRSRLKGIEEWRKSLVNIDFKG